MDAPAISVASLRNSLASGRSPLVIDVRKGSTFVGARDLIRGAWRGPELHTWNPEAYK